MINTIGKKIHTLVKENTPHRHKIRQEWGFTQKFTFFAYHCVFFPTAVQILVGRLDLCFLTHIKKKITPIHALIFQKHVNMCVFIRRIKKTVYFYNTFWEVHAAKKGWLGGHSFRTWLCRVRAT